jgi:hypothetical protein
MTTNSATSVSFGNAIECPRCPRAERDAQRLREADEERRDEGAGDRAQAAGDGDDERLRDDGEVHAEVGRARGAVASAPASPARQRPEREHQVNSMRALTPSALGERAVLGRRAHERAEPVRSTSPHSASSTRGPTRAGTGRRSGSRGRRSASRRSIRRARAEQVLPRPRRSGPSTHDEARCRTCAASCSNSGAA